MSRRPLELVRATRSDKHRPRSSAGPAEFSPMSQGRCEARKVSDYEAYWDDQRIRVRRPWATRAHTHLQRCPMTAPLQVADACTMTSFRASRDDEQDPFISAADCACDDTLKHQAYETGCRSTRVYPVLLCAGRRESTSHRRRPVSRRCSYPQLAGSSPDQTNWDCVSLTQSVRRTTRRRSAQISFEARLFLAWI